MDTGLVMDEIGDRLGTIPNLNVLPYEADDINVPAALISLPAPIDYSATYNRGMDKMTIMVTIAVSLVDDRVRRDEITPYGNGSGARSVKKVLETGEYGSFDMIFVRQAIHDVVDIGGVEYLAVIFTCNIAGRGETRS